MDLIVPKLETDRLDRQINVRHIGKIIAYISHTRKHPPHPGERVGIPLVGKHSQTVKLNNAGLVSRVNESMYCSASVELCQHAAQPITESSFVPLAR